MNVVSIPQAVGTVATLYLLYFQQSQLLQGFNTASGRHCCNRYRLSNNDQVSTDCFNTASGRHCCNYANSIRSNRPNRDVSIPQAVGTVATTLLEKLSLVKKRFQYRKRQALLQLIKKLGSRWIANNKLVSIPQAVGTVATFRTCNRFETNKIKFQYRKRQALLQQRGLESQYSCGSKSQFWKTSNRKR